MELGMVLVGKACVLIKESSRYDLVDRGKQWSEDRTLGDFCNEEAFTCKISQGKHKFREEGICILKVNKPIFYLFIVILSTRLILCNVFCKCLYIN